MPTMFRIAAMVAPALLATAIRVARRGHVMEKQTINPDYDCNQDGNNECKKWDYGAVRCVNPEICKYKYKFGDFHLGQSCRCRWSKVTEYDCNGDGKRDCKDWDYSKAQCKNGYKCKYKYKFGDALFDQSCRCKSECLGPDALSKPECRPKPNDYDCDGDGTEECGSWSYGKAQCKNLATCEHKYKFGDITFDESCRCRRCDRANTANSPDSDKNLVPTPNPAVAGNSGYWARWINWADHMDTCAPWMMPQNDADLRKLLSYAKNKGYIVRPSGAGHSAGGLVNDGKDKRVMVVSLGAYKSPVDYWEFNVDYSKSKMTVNAGWSQLDVYQRIRPKNLFFPTQTAGYFFQIAGVIANSVHGAGYQRSFIHSYVTKMRVMLADGTLKFVEGDELRYWRNSFGLLGIILSVEMQLDLRTKHQMYTKTAEYQWNEENFWKFIFENAEADLPVSITNGKRSVGGTRRSSAGEFFVNLLPDKPGFLVYANKENDNAMEGGISSGVPPNLSSNYQALRSEKVQKFVHNGKITYGESVRKEGCPALHIDPFKIINVNTLVGSKLVPTLAKVIEPLAFSFQTLKQLPKLVKEQREKTNDGFFATKAPNTLIAAYFIRPELSFKAFDFMRSRVRARNGQATWFNAEGFSWNQPAEFRFMNVTEDAVLQPVPPGIWFVSEILSFPDSAATDQAWKEAFKEIEDYWVNELGAIPHLGKLFGFEKGAGGDIELFHQSRVCKVYSDAAKESFKKYQATVDPAGRFNYGLGEKLLRNC